MIGSSVSSPVDIRKKIPKRVQIATQFIPVDLSWDKVPNEGSESLPKSDHAKLGFLAGNGKREFYNQICPKTRKIFILGPINVLRAYRNMGILRRISIF